jgi:hypothetical protein
MYIVHAVSPSSDTESKPNQDVRPVVALEIIDFVSNYTLNLDSLPQGEEKGEVCLGCARVQFLGQSASRHELNSLLAPDMFSSRRAPAIGASRLCIAHVPPRQIWHHSLLGSSNSREEQAR